MKKYLKIIFILICIISFNNEISAIEYGKLNVTYEDNIYYTLTDNKGLYISELFPFYTINNSIVYCITPNESVNSIDYVGAEGSFYFPYNAGINNSFDKIVHYGYEYINHNTIKYRLATQALIWETLGKNVEFWTKQNELVETIDITKEKEEIIMLGNKHLTLPSYNENTIINYVNHEMTIEDENNVLSNFEVINAGGNKVQIKDNLLSIVSFKPGESKIKLANITYDDEESMTYIGNGTESKKFGKFRIGGIITSRINIKTIGAKIKIVNIDKDTNEAIKKEGIKFKIKNLDTNEYVCDSDDCIYITNDEGIFTTTSYLAGNYQIESQENNIDGYSYNDNTLKITIDENTILDDNYIYTAKLEHEKLIGKVEINVIGQAVNFIDDSYSYEDILLENAVYGLYANEDIYINESLNYKKDDLISKLTTDEKGQAYIENLELGSYYLKQIKSSNGNKIDETRYEFILDETTKKFKFNNYLPKGSLEFVKVDEESNLGLSNSLMKIYYKNNNEYILIYQGHTNEIGNINLDNLPFGEYYIKEIQSKEGYVNENKIIDFEIKENNQIIKLSMKNSLVFDIPNTSLNKSSLLNYIGILLLIISFGMKKYEKT